MNLVNTWILKLDGQTLPERRLIGGKAWSVARLSTLGLPVPPAFVVTTEAYASYAKNGVLPDGLAKELEQSIAWLETKTGRRFGAGPRPLLVSVRSGAAISMPGMMDSVLNLGMTTQTEEFLAEESGNPEFATDTHRRFLQLFGDIVCKASVGQLDTSGDPTFWRGQIADKSGRAVPEGAMEQLLEAVAAVFESWNSRRARRYRDHHDISHDLGTAVTVQAMVFGNLDEMSGTGVVFSRNPSTGAPKIFGEYLAMAQGEDVVSGVFSPGPLTDLKARVPAAYDELLAATKVLEVEDRTVQDIEFTVERGRLYLLQSRAAKMSPGAVVRAAVDMVTDGVIDPRAALERISPDQIRQLLAPKLMHDAAEKAVVVGKGEGVCSGVGIGVVVGDADEAERRAAGGELVVLARPTTSPHDVHGMIAAAAVITEEGGSTSHAAVVSRALGRPSVVGCGADALQNLIGRIVTVDGGSGTIFDGALPVEVNDELSNPMLAQIMSWAKDQSPLEVYSPATAPSGPILDLDDVDGGEDPERLASFLAEVSVSDFPGLQGGAIHSSAAIHSAVVSGFAFIVAEPILPCLIAAAQAANQLAASYDKKIGNLKNV